MERDGHGPSAEFSEHGLLGDYSGSLHGRVLSCRLRVVPKHQMTAALAPLPV